MTFDEKLRAQMAIKRISQAALAQKMGVSESKASRWCRGLNVPNILELRDLCEVLSCEASDLMPDAEEEEERKAS